MPRSKLKVSLNYLETWLMGALEAQIIGVEIDDTAVIFTIEGADVPDGLALVRLETVTSRTTKLVAA